MLPEAPPHVEDDTSLLPWPGKAAFEAHALRSHGQTARHAMEGIAWDEKGKEKLQRKGISLWSLYMV